MIPRGRGTTNKVSLLYLNVLALISCYKDTECEVFQSSENTWYILIKHYIKFLLHSRPLPRDDSCCQEDRSKSIPGTDRDIEGGPKAVVRNGARKTLHMPVTDSRKTLLHT